MRFSEKSKKVFKQFNQEEIYNLDNIQILWVMKTLVREGMFKTKTCDPEKIFDYLDHWVKKIEEGETNA